MVILSKDVNSQQGDFLNVPTPSVFNDQSALNVKSNLQSQQYQDFIHQLYRFDKDNLKRVDNLFANPEQVDQSNINQQQQQPKQPTYASWIQTQPEYNSGTGRYKRDAHGAIFRPRFVYRIFQDLKQDRIREREELRIQKRLYESYKHRLQSANYLKNQYEY